MPSASASAWVRSMVSEMAASAARDLTASTSAPISLSVRSSKAGLRLLRLLINLE